MIFTLVLSFFGLAATASNHLVPRPLLENNLAKNERRIQRSWLDQIMPILFEFVRVIIKNGEPSLGIPVMDPLQVEKFNFIMPTGLVNLKLELKQIYATGISGFEVYTGRLDLANLFFDLDVAVPSLDISAEHYNFTGNLLPTASLYGRGRAVFKIEGLRFSFKIFLKQSPNEKSIIIDRLDDVGFQIPLFKSQLTGAIGGRDIDDALNTQISEVIVDYINRFQGSISSVISRTVPGAVNPILEKYKSWEFVDKFEHL